ncbi:MAG TPA: cupin domain-containing protein [Alphaproteobacteria bacterium]|nr:cupin domain-containing protein [Alphaproteobacteria bacterium]
MSTAAKLAAKIAPELYHIRENGRIPNNDRLPLLLYRSALSVSGDDPAAACLALFSRNNWRGGWRNGIYAYHHYHTTAHEVLGIVFGEARVCFGGEGGQSVTVRAGDVVVIPAGVAHKSERASEDLLVVGAYPDGRKPDICDGTGEDRAHELERIRRVSRPTLDPLYGLNGPLAEHWGTSQRN